ncbi:zinc finger protein, putative [Pediculus humanus corporis]|uniref:Zinc finger protein, putative n=1 Tax=Pediculus humanus subsp. corporis TaxID=121224 RepID=E0W0N7_PEDHC|nr:zinc finger protein, putative [Pediculus humanus corporis]EEB19193.1 zinc finger protein, putative [Pediculus humanus corporis]
MFNYFSNNIIVSIQCIESPFENKRDNRCDNCSTTTTTTTNDDALCIVCQSNAKNVVIFPCKHLCLCLDCSLTIMNTQRKNCPICRRHIDNTIEVYL